MGVEAKSPDRSRVTPPDQSIVDFVSPFVSAAYRRIRRNKYATPSTSLTGDISRLASNVGEFDLETDQDLLQRNGITFKQLEQRRFAVRHLERTPKPKRHHIRNDGTLDHSKRPREEPEVLDDDFLKGTLKPKKLCQDKVQEVLDTTDPIETSNSVISLGNIVDDKDGDVLDTTLNVSVSRLPDSKELDKLNDILESSESNLPNSKDLES